MKVLVASTVVPGVLGGGTTIVDSLERALQRHGHEVDVLRLPFDTAPERLLEQMVALRLHAVADHGDRLVCIRTPSYLLQHPHKRIWFIHHHRAAYDLWGTEYGDIPDSRGGRALRDVIHHTDELGFREAERIFANSRVIRDRLRHFNGRDVDVLYAPLDDPDIFRCDSYNDTIVYVSRITGHKRQALAVEAMRHVRTPVRLCIAGMAYRGPEEVRLRELVASHNLADRVELRLHWISDAEKVDLYARALAVVYCPFDEDSYGYVSLEAHQSHKAVVSTTDAGGVAELITDGVNGFLTEPTPEALAKRFDELYEDRALAERMGTAGMQRMTELGISWDRVITNLLAP